MNRSIVELMLEFLDKREPSILIANSAVDLETLVVIAINILDWLKLERKRELWIEQGRKTCLKPLELNLDWSWCNQLSDYTRNELCFSSVFSVQNGKMDFRQDIAEDYKEKLRVQAYEMYKPEMVIG